MRPFLSPIALLATLALLLLAGAAQAARLPSKAEQAAITKTIVTSVKGGFPKGTRFPVTHARVSTVDGRYAAARVGPPTKGGRALTDRAVVVLHRGPHGWKVVDLGTAEVGCTTLPKAVERDLLGAAWCGR